MKNGWIRWKNENPCFKNFFGVTTFDLALGEDEESPWVSEGRNLKSQNGFFTIDSSRSEFSGSILRFENSRAQTKILQFEGFLLTLEIFWKMGFHFFIEFNHFSSNLDQGAILGVKSRKPRTCPKTIFLRLSMEELRHEEESWFSKKFLSIEILYLANFPLLLIFHGSNILIKISFFLYFKQSLKSMDFTSRKFEQGIP